MHIPKKMLVVDVAPRDGLQSLPNWIPTDDKVWLCDRLTDLGVRRVSVGSALSRVAWGAFIRAAESILATGTFDAFAEAVPFAQLDGVFAKRS